MKKETCKQNIWQVKKGILCVKIVVRHVEIKIIKRKIFDMLMVWYLTCRKISDK